MEANFFIISKENRVKIGGIQLFEIGQHATCTKNSATFPRPSIPATPIHSRHLYFPPVSTFGLPEHDFMYSLKVQCILNLAKYFFSIASSFLLLFIASVPVN